MLCARFELACLRRRELLRTLVQARMATLADRREAQALKVCVTSRTDRVGRIRYLTRKELLDEVNALNKSPHDFALSPSVLRQQGRGANLLRPRDVRKVDPNFSTSASDGPDPSSSRSRPRFLSSASLTVVWSTSMRRARASHPRACRLCTCPPLKHSPAVV